jgi:mannose-6-phosphate isomerase
MGKGRPDGALGPNRTTTTTQRNLVTEERPWGRWTVLEEGPGYKIKRIEVKPGHRLSLQMHHHRSEHWIVLSGTAKVVKGGEVLYVHPHESTFVPAATHHRIENPGLLPLVIIEIANGEYLGEDDIVRFEDDYQRPTRSPSGNSGRRPRRRASGA